MAASLQMLYFKQGKKDSPEDFTQNISNEHVTLTLYGYWERILFS